MIYPPAEKLIRYSQGVSLYEKQIIQLLERNVDELDIEFEGIAEPKMDVTSYTELKTILLVRIFAWYVNSPKNTKDQL